MTEGLKTIIGAKRSWKEEGSDCHKVLSLSETGRSSIIRNQFISRNTVEHIGLVKVRLKFLILENLYINFDVT